MAQFSCEAHAGGCSGSWRQQGSQNQKTFLVWQKMMQQDDIVKIRHGHKVRVSRGDNKTRPKSGKAEKKERNLALLCNQLF